MSASDPLIRTKLHRPFSRPNLVTRSRLQEQIVAGLQGPLTLIVAPAGFGKTTLVASSLDGCSIPVAWLSLDEGDNQTGHFLSYLIAALQTVDEKIGCDTPPILAGMDAAPDTVLAGLINDIEAAAVEMALVLDDFQFIHSQAVQGAVSFLLDHCPPSFHLLVATRSDPPLPLARLRARGQMVELRAADLRFSAEETALFIHDVMGVDLEAEAVLKLEERTEGWVAGLQMAALSMRGRADVAGFLARFSGTNRYILDYLLEEVLDREPPEIQRFLLDTSGLKRLCAPLCDEILQGPEFVQHSAPQVPLRPSDSQSILEYLERSSLFLVPLDDERRWYRYHHLFADLLQAKLRQSRPAEVATLLSRAATWCEQNGQSSQAVEYALSANDNVLAARLIGKYWGPIANTGEVETVWRWMNALPEAVLRTDAWLSVSYCWLLWLRGQVAEIEAHVPAAERAVNQMARSAGASAEEAVYAGLPAMIKVLRSIVARYHNDFGTATEMGEQAAGLMPDDLPPPVDAQFRTLIFLALSSAYEGAGELAKAADAYLESIHWSRISANPTGVCGMTYRLLAVLWPLGRLRQAENACREAMAYLNSQGMEGMPAAGILHIALGEVLLEQNHLPDVDAHLVRAMDLGIWSGRMDAVKNAPYVRMRLSLARHDIAGALGAVQEAEAAQADLGPSLVQSGLLALRARVLLKQGLMMEATQCAEEAVRMAAQERGSVWQRAELALCRVRLAQRKPAEAIEYLTQELAAVETAGRRGVRLQLLIWLSIAHSRMNDTQAAKTDLEQAFGLAEPEGYVRIFLDEGPLMQSLLAGWLAHAGDSPWRNYVNYLLSQFGAEPQITQAASSKNSPNKELVEPLSDRELEVLQLIAIGKPNSEIARQLVVAPGTVKAHTASIYRKLGVANRTEAAARARQLAILP